MSQFGRKLIRSAKNYTKGYTGIQIKVRGATSNNPVGPSGALMAEIAELTYDPQKVMEILEIMHKRLNDSGKNWRHVFKSLLLLDYLLRTGSETIVFYAQSNKYIIKTLKYFEYIDVYGRDQGANVRQKSRDITELLEDKARLQKERKQHQKLKVSSGNAYRSSGNSESNSVMLDDLENKELNRAIEESRRSYYIDQINRTSNNSLANMPENSQLTSDLSIDEADRDFSMKIHRYEIEQLELNKKILSQMDNNITITSSGTDPSIYNENSINTASYSSLPNPIYPDIPPSFSQFGTSVPPAITSQSLPSSIHQPLPSSIHQSLPPSLPPSVPHQSLPPSLPSSLPSSSMPPLLWSNTQTLPPNHPSYHLPNSNGCPSDAFIDPFEALAQNAKDFLISKTLNNAHPDISARPDINVHPVNHPPALARDNINPSPPSSVPLNTNSLHVPSSYPQHPSTISSLLNFPSIEPPPPSSFPLPSSSLQPGSTPDYFFPPPPNHPPHLLNPSNPLPPTQQHHPPYQQQNNNNIVPNASYLPQHNQSR